MRPHVVTPPLPAILLLCSCLVIFGTGCAALQRGSHDVPPDIVSPDDGPPSVVIMPFANRSTHIGLSADVRQSFAAHFSTRRYHDIELQETDARLDALEQQFGCSWRGIQPAEAARFFGAAYVLTGEVRSFRKRYYLFYSQLALAVRLKLVEARTGAIVWQRTITRRSHSGEVPFGPGSLLTAPIRCGLHLQDARINALVEQTSAALVAAMPHLASRLDGALPVNVRVGSYLERRHARSLARRLEQEGFAVHIEKVRIDAQRWYRLYVGPYPYETISAVCHRLASRGLPAEMIVRLRTAG